MLVSGALKANLVVLFIVNLIVTCYNSSIFSFGSGQLQFKVKKIRF